MTVSVLMPTFGQAAFITRAIESLLAQRYAEWELIVVDDGSTDGTADLLTRFVDDPRIRVHRNDHNEGLGAALNRALSIATGDLIAYLPSDDVWYQNHLADLVAALNANDAVLAYSGVRYRYNRESAGAVPDLPLQLVQVLHRRSEVRWVERAELTTDDLDRMFWDKLRAVGEFVGTGRITCEWVDHPHQRHKVVQEPEGGINPYRLRYDVKTPLVFHTTKGHRIDEDTRYRPFRERDYPAKPGGLKIVLCGELAYNPERVLALAEAGHTLYGLWTDTPYWYNWIGPLPFGHVEELPREDWEAALRRIKPDVIYALLNWQAVPFCHRVLEANPGVPFVWHYKEGPFISLEKGHWRELVELHARADGAIYTSAELRDWFATFAPETQNGRPQLILDGDLPKRDWFGGARSARLSDFDGEIHTVVPGRPIGLHPECVAAMANEGVHLHFYGEFTQGQWKGWIERTRSLAGRFIHLHGNVDQERWVQEFSRYDAGWLHSFTSVNHGELRCANWDDLNLPARMATLAVCGLPMIQFANPGHIVATQRIAEEQGLGVTYQTFPELADKLKAPTLRDIAQNVWDKRADFTFDAHVPALTSFFEAVAAR